MAVTLREAKLFVYVIVKLKACIKHTLEIVQLSLWDQAEAFNISLILQCIVSIRDPLSSQKAQ